MGTRTVFLRSPLGSRVRSPLGAFQCHADRFLEIFTVPLFMLEGETYQVTGELFGAVQGTGELLVCNTEAGDDVAISQTVSAWADDEITFDFADAGDDLPDNGVVWIKVIANSGQFDAMDTRTSTINSATAIGARVFSQSAGINRCDLDPGNDVNYCTVGFIDFAGDLESTGYVDPDIQAADYILTAQQFFAETPGFIIIGQTSGKAVTYLRRDHYSVAGIGAPPADLSAWCETEGLFTGYGEYSISGSLGFFILYDVLPPGDPCADDHGWSDGETSYLVPLYPVSIQITLPVAGTEFPIGADVTMEAYAFDVSGDISHLIEWYLYTVGVPSLIGTGPSVVLNDVDEEKVIRAKVTSTRDQRRVTPVFNVLVVELEILDLFPQVGNTGGGQRVYVFGTGFTATTTIEFDGVEADNIVFIDSTLIKCDTPAGSGNVAVEAIDGAQSSLWDDPGFTYDTIDNVSITSIAPDDGDEAGGTAVTITGTGFTSDSIVEFGDWFTGTSSATSITVVDDTEITCDTPAGTGTVDVIVWDPVTGGGDILRLSFTYTP